MVPATDPPLEDSVNTTEFTAAPNVAVGVLDVATPVAPDVGVTDETVGGAVVDVLKTTSTQ